MLRPHRTAPCIVVSTVRLVVISAANRAVADAAVGILSSVLSIESPKGFNKWRVNFQPIGLCCFYSSLWAERPSRSPQLQAHARELRPFASYNRTLQENSALLTLRKRLRQCLGWAKYTTRPRLFWAHQGLFWL